MPSPQWTCTHVRACAPPSQLLRDKYLETYSVMLYTKYVDRLCCNFFGLFAGKCSKYYCVCRNYICICYEKDKNCWSVFWCKCLVFLRFLFRCRRLTDYTVFVKCRFYHRSFGLCSSLRQQFSKSSPSFSVKAAFCVTDRPAWMERSATFHRAQVMSIHFIRMNSQITLFVPWPAGRKQKRFRWVWYELMHGSLKSF